MQSAQSIPAGWLPEAQALWAQGRPQEAIEVVLAAINAAPAPLPRQPAMQFAYYLAMRGDWGAAAGVLTRVCAAYPDDREARLNLGVSQSRMGDVDAALKTLRAVVAGDSENATAWDSLASVYARLGDHEQAREAGENALSLKDAGGQPCDPAWTLPAQAPAHFARQPGKRDVISFSLWGSRPRYLRGALRNALLAADIYPGWRCRFYVDVSVPEEFVRVLRELDAEIVVPPSESATSLRERLARRFWVADDPGVGYFIVRDCDSVIGVREANAVAAWLDSGKWFHVMRDGWTHTDPMLAGMWGGVAGALPELRALFRNYRGRHVETPNWDQWFLRDCVWPYVRRSCLVHDRCFRHAGSQAFPGGERTGERHVGKDEYAIDRALQARVLAPWIERLACLR